MRVKLLQLAVLAILQAFSSSTGTAFAQEIPSTILGPESAWGVNAYGQVAGKSDWQAVLWNGDGSVQRLPGLGGRSLALALNDLGVVVGVCGLTAGYVYPFHACAWVGGATLDLGAPGGDDSRANAVNNVGQIVGDVEGTGSGDAAMMWTVDASWRISSKALGTLGGFSSSAQDVNDRGEVVGWSHMLSGRQHAFLWTPDGAMQDLGTLPGGTGSGATGINALGHVTGWSEVQLRDTNGDPVYTPWGDPLKIIHAFLWTPEAGMIDLDPAGGVVDSLLTRAESGGEALNDRDEVVGHRSAQGSPATATAVRAFFWSPEQGRIDLPMPEATDTLSRAYDLNNDGTVVGEAGYTAVVWHVRPQVTDSPPPPLPPPPPYQFIGFASPLLNDGTAELELGKRLPVEFQLVDWRGGFVATATPTLHVFRTVGDVVETTDLAPAGATFRYERHANRYSYDLSTRALGAGTFVLRVDLEDGSHEVSFAIRARVRR